VVVKQAGERGLGVGVDFAHEESLLTTDFTDGHESIHLTSHSERSEESSGMAAAVIMLDPALRSG
jgi:hypothetical protein